MLRSTRSHQPVHPATVAIRLGAVLALAIAGLLALPGCNIVGPIAILVAGPPKDEAKFELDKTKTTVIFVDDRAGVLRQRIIRDRIGIAAEKQILAKGLVTDMIQGQLAQVAARQDRNRQLLSIAAIGRACQAEVVIYADVADYSITPDGAAYKPNAVLKIKIIDAKTEARIFPAPDAPLDHYPAATVLLAGRCGSRSRRGMYPSSRGGEDHKAADGWIRLSPALKTLPASYGQWVNSKLASVKSKQELLEAMDDIKMTLLGLNKNPVAPWQ